MKSIKIAPAFNEIKVTKNIVSTDFNGVHLEYTMPEDEFLKVNPLVVKAALRDAIALSSKTWQIEYCLNDYFQWKGKLTAKGCQK